MTSIVSTVPGKCLGSNISTFTPIGIFSYVRRVKELGYYHQCVPTGWGLYQGTKNEKSLNAPCHVGGRGGHDYK